MTSHGRMSTQIMLSHLKEYYVALKAMSLKLFNSVEKCFQKCLSGKKKTKPKLQNGIGIAISSTQRRNQYNQNNSDYSSMRQLWEMSFL